MSFNRSCVVLYLLPAPCMAGACPCPCKYPPIHTTHAHHALCAGMTKGRSAYSSPALVSWSRVFPTDTGRTRCLSLSALPCSVSPVLPAVPVQACCVPFPLSQQSAAVLAPVRCLHIALPGRSIDSPSACPKVVVAWWVQRPPLPKYSRCLSQRFHFFLLLSILLSFTIRMYI
jgi:hypothetical protein